MRYNQGLEEIQIGDTVESSAYYRLRDSGIYKVKDVGKFIIYKKISSRRPGEFVSDILPV